MQNKREIAKEFKAYKEHKSEATKLTKLRKDKVSPDLPRQHRRWRTAETDCSLSTSRTIS